MKAMIMQGIVAMAHDSIYRHFYQITNFLDHMAIDNVCSYFCWYIAGYHPVCTPSGCQVTRHRQRWLSWHGRSRPLSFNDNSKNSGGINI